MTAYNSLNLESFYPEFIKIIGQSLDEDTIGLKVKSTTHEASCPLCQRSTSSYHSTYDRTVQDLPILGKRVMLDVTAYRYYCENNECSQKVFAEELEGFAGWYRRKTDRLEDLIITIAINTSCEACSRICKHMGIDISGDSVIRLIKKHSEKLDVSCSEIIGVDVWAYKKGQNYGTIICDGKTHEPVELLDGRDGCDLREWLLNNKHIKMVTRDRASAYAKVISEVLPDAIPIADRFHLHQNLLKAVKEALTRELPNKISISEDNKDLDGKSTHQYSGDKKKRTDRKPKAT